MRPLGEALTQSAGVLKRTDLNPQRDTKAVDTERKGHVKSQG